MVFPLGMYAVATHALGARLELGALMRVSTIAFCCARAAWAVTALSGYLSRSESWTSWRGGSPVSKAG